MDAVALPFAIMGFTLGIVAFTQISVISKKLDKLEQRLSAIEGDEPEERS